MNGNPLSPYVRHAMHHTYIKGYFIERHIWDHEIIYINKGKMRITIADRTYTVSENDCILLRPDVYHRIEWAGEDCEQPHVHFDFFYRDDSPEVTVSMKLKEHMTERELSYFREDYYAANGLDIPDVIRLRNPYRVKELLDQIIDEFTYKVNYSGYYLQGLVTQLFATILRDYHLGIADANSPYSHELDDLIVFMSEHVNENLSLDDLAREAGMGKWNLNHLFKQRYNITPIRYFNRLKYNQAKRCLQFTSKTIKEVAYTMGFDSPQSFSRWFKAMDNRTPGYYHKKSVHMKPKGLI
ncbi:MAG: AraC family transcriptional regulator [Acholeplasmataceae bacterium]